jgi:hypothetical protein
MPSSPMRYTLGYYTWLKVYPPLALSSGAVKQDGAEENRRLLCPVVSRHAFVHNANRSLPGQDQFIP